MTMTIQSRCAVSPRAAGTNTHARGGSLAAGGDR
jgi:hypothetical protein